MLFNQKLKQAMQELHLNQAQICGLTGKSKASVSNYLSGKQVPSEEAQQEIATALGLASNYFAKPEKRVDALPSSELRNKVIPRMDVREAARIMNMAHTTVRAGLQQGVFPWGYAIHTSDNRWTYFINAKRFAGIEGIAVEEKEGGAL